MAHRRVHVNSTLLIVATLLARLTVAQPSSPSGQEGSPPVAAVGPGAAPAGAEVRYRVALHKQYVPVQREGKTVAYKTAYYGQVRIGSPEPQVFTVVFDTGSGHLILPSASCRSAACQQHRRYNRTVSESAVDIEYDGSVLPPDAKERDQLSIAFGTGQVLGEFVQEVVCLAQPPAPFAGDSPPEGCVTLRVVLATEMTDDPFALFAFDGVLGLGLSSLALSPAFSILDSMSRQHPAVHPSFGVFLARHARPEFEGGADGVITFGGHDERFAASELSWAPVALDELGFWQVQLRSVRVGDQVLQDCVDGGCRAILDTGTSLLGVPKQSARALHRMLARQVPDAMLDEEAGVGDMLAVPSGAPLPGDEPVRGIDCRRVPGAAIHFDLASGATVSLLPEDYSRPTPFNMTLPGGSGESRLFCRSLLLPVDLQAPLGPRVFIWGEPVLRRYYTAYDLGAKRVGFALARQPPLAVVASPSPDAVMAI